MNGETFHKALIGEEDKEPRPALFPTREEIDLLRAWHPCGTAWPSAAPRSAVGQCAAPRRAAPGIPQIVTAPTGK